MDTNAAIDVAIELFLMYLFLALICAAFNETMASITILRATTLASGIKTIIDDRKLQVAFQATGPIKGSAAASGARKGPSYIPARTFSLGLLEALNPGKSVSESRTMKEAQTTIDQLPDSTIKQTLAAISRDTSDNVDECKRR